MALGVEVVKTSILWYRFGGELSKNARKIFESEKQCRRYMSRAVVRAGATGAWAPVEIWQRVLSTSLEQRQYY